MDYVVAHSKCAAANSSKGIGQSTRVDTGLLRSKRDRTFMLPGARACIDLMKLGAAVREFAKAGVHALNADAQRCISGKQMVQSMHI